MSATPTSKALLFVAVNWTVSAYNTSLIETLHERGYRVDLLVTGRTRFRFTSFPQSAGKLIVVCNKWPRLYHHFWTLWRCFSIAFRFLFPVDPWLRHAARTMLSGNDYEAVIAIEKESLLLMGLTGIACELGAKLHFWSHELYTVGYPRYYRYRSLDHWALKNLTMADGIIVQDEQRHRVLVRYAPGPCPKPFKLPVTERGDAYHGPKTDLHSRFGLAPGTKLVVSHGLIGKLRGFDLLCDLANKLRSDCVILVQGERLEEVTRAIPENLIMVEDSLDHPSLLVFLASCHLGIALYAQNQIENDRLTARSSHKMALYARCGLPFLALSNESYQALLSEVAWGALINSSEDGRKAIDTILSSLPSFRQKAFEGYEKIYRLESYAAGLESYILRSHLKVDLN